MAERLRECCPCLKALWDILLRRPRDHGTGGGKPDSSSISSSSSAVDAVIPKHDGGAESSGRYAPSTGRRASGDGAVYTALWGFEARDEEELSFKKGDKFKIVSSAGEWWTARKIDASGRTLGIGYVPFNYLERGESDASQPWFFGQMNRVESLSHLMSAENGDGAFLVRISETDNVDHVLSVKVNDKAKHFKIYKNQNGFYLEQARFFLSLLELIEYYQCNRLASVDRLRKPCIRRMPQPKDLSHSTVDKWELPKDDFTLDKLLGSGYFAEVYHGKWRNRIEVAIKILKKDTSLSTQEFYREVEVLKRLRHRNLISLMGICTSSAPYYIITEFMSKGNLLDFLRSSERKALDMVALVDMASQVADGMSYLEEQKSIHRDLAARNVLVGEGNICKVADFGLARFVKEPFYVSEEKKIPYKWTAPEALKHRRFSSKSDVWSFGILLYEIVTYGGVPYPGYSASEAVSQITTKGYRMPRPATCPVLIYQIMFSCWSEEPDNRPSFKRLKSDLENLSRYSEIN